MVSIKEKIQDLVDKEQIAADAADYFAEPQNVHEFQVEVEGVNHKLDAYRVRHNTDRGPGKGGIRFHPGVDLDEVKELSFWMSLKTSLVRLPYGGAKGGVSVDPRGLSDQQKEELSRSYIRGIYDEIGPNKDIPAPDVYTDEKTMGIMLDEYESIHGSHEPAVITGKPVSLGGIPSRSTATGRGAAHVFHEHFNQPRTVAVQGFGNAGRQFARELKDTEHKILAVSDSSGAILDEDGLDVQSVSQAKDRTGSVTNTPKATEITNEELLRLDVDVLTPAALGGVITEDNADDIEAGTVFEIANGPVTDKADTILRENNVTVLPDILVNSGGVIVSYCEWSQNRSGESWTAGRVDDVLHERMITAYNDINKSDLPGTWRQKAYTIALTRILEAAKHRGKR